MKPLEIVEFIENWADPELQLSWDNSGIQIYSGVETESVVICMDLTDNALKYALEKGSRFILTHHPLFFTGVKRIDRRYYKGELIADLIKNDITVYSAHTSMDIAGGGVNYTIAENLGLKNLYPLSIEENLELGLVGELPEEYSLEEFIAHVEKSFNTSEIKGYGRKPESVKIVGVLGGAGAGNIADAADKNCDVFITGDIGHHDAQRAYESGIFLIGLTHYDSELPILYKMARELSSNLSIESFIYSKNDFYADEWK